MTMTTRATRILSSIAAVAAVAALPTTAGAATLVPAADYESAKQASTCHLGGSSDENGVFYTSNCSNKIFRYDRNGVRLADIAIPTGVSNPRDVAPSPDGKILYLSQGTKTFVRIVLQANGKYARDAAWVPEKFTYGGKQWAPIGHMLTTDGRGDIYMSNGSKWVSDAVKTPAAIVKYGPDGKVITGFGDHGTAPGMWNTNQDVAVSRDGRRVYVGENCGLSCKNGAKDYNASRITRYDYTPGGLYRFTRIISPQGPTNGRPFPQCEDPGAVHSAYTLALDAAENLIAGSVSCGYLQKYSTDPDPAKDAFVKTIAKKVNTNNHELSVDWAGRVYTSEWGVRISPKNPVLPAMPRPAIPALPAPDTVAPVLGNVVLPVRTNARGVNVAITATDAVGVAEMRFANEDGTYGPWQPFVTPAVHQLTDGFGVKGVFVQVRDMAGNESNAVYRTTSFEQAPDGGQPDPGVPPAPNPVGDIAAPVIANATAPAVTATRDITITIDATDDVAVRMVRFANEDGNWSAWRNFAAASTWTITDGYLNKAITVQVRDAAGNESNTTVVRTRYAVDAPPVNPNPGAPADTVAPTLTRITMPAETTTQNVNIGLTAADNVAVAQVRFANEDGNWTNWQAYANPKTWTLSANFGGKLVFAQVRDAAGNESLTATATTMHVKEVAAPGAPVDTKDPVLTAITLPGTVPNANVTVQLAGTDDIGITEVRFANEDGNWLPWKAYGNGEVAHVLTAGATNKLVFAQVRDAAGRESNVLYTPTLVTP